MRELNALSAKVVAACLVVLFLITSLMFTVGLLIGEQANRSLIQRYEKQLSDQEQKIDEQQFVIKVRDAQLASMAQAVHARAETVSIEGSALPSAMPARNKPSVPFSQCEINSSTSLADCLTKNRLMK